MAKVIQKKLKSTVLVLTIILGMLLALSANAYGALEGSTNENRGSAPSITAASTEIMTHYDGPRFFKFVPTASVNYTISTSNVQYSATTYCWLYDSVDHCVAEGDSITWGLTANQTYYIGVLNWDEPSATCMLNITGGGIQGSYTPPTVTTDDITIYTDTTATLGGNVTDQGSSAVTERGYVYSSTDATPTIGEAGVTQVADGSGTGAFSEDISGLTASTTYYVCAYATNNSGTSYAYGTIKSFTTLSSDTAPTVTDKTISSSNITQTGVTITWNKATDDVSTQSALQYLVYQSSSNNLDSVTNIETNGTAIGSYTADIATKAVTGLTAGTTYYFNVIVKDEAGNKTCYTAKSVTTEAAESAKIYYTESQVVGSDNSTYYRLRRANLADGSSAETLYWSELGTPEGVAVDLDGGYVYFSDPFASVGEIYRANLDGSNKITLISGVYANDIAIDTVHGKIYYTEAQTVGTDKTTYYRLRWANLSDGSSVATLYWSEAGTPEGVAVDPDAGYVYFSDPLATVGKIYRADLDGSNMTTLISGVYANDIAIDTVHGKIYYTESQTVGTDKTTYYRLRRANLADGSSAETLYWSELGTPEGVAVDPDGGYVYFSDPLASIGEIYRADLDGSNKITLISGVYANKIAVPIASLSSDTIAPTVTDKAISSSNITQTGVTLTWNKATDDTSAQTALQYLVYRSSSNNLDSVTNIETNGTAISSYTADIATKAVTGLTAGTTYYFNVIVKDEAGNKTCYTAKSVTTLTNASVELTEVSWQSASTYTCGVEMSSSSKMVTISVDCGHFTVPSLGSGVLTFLGGTSGTTYVSVDSYTSDKEFSSAVFSFTNVLDAEALLSNIIYSPDGAAQQKITVTASTVSPLAGDIYFEEHFYRYVGTPTNWLGAVLSSSDTTDPYFGGRGYIATATSQAENSILLKLVENGGGGADHWNDAWMGGLWQRNTGSVASPVIIRGVDGNEITYDNFKNATEAQRQSMLVNYSLTFSDFNASDHSTYIYAKPESVKYYWIDGPEAGQEIANNTEGFAPWHVTSGTQDEPNGGDFVYIGWQGAYWDDLNSYSSTVSGHIVEFSGFAGGSTAGIVIGDTKTVSFCTAPTLTATGGTPTFLQGSGSGVDLFSSVTAATNDSGQTFSGATLTVTNVADTTEYLTIGGTDLALSNGNSGSIASGGNFSVSKAGSTATVTLNGMALSDANMGTLIDGITYKNSDATVTTGDRVITLTSVTDSGSSNNSATLSIAATVNNAVAPTVSGVSGPSAGTYQIGDELDFTATFSENVTVSGAPYIALTIGNTTRNATYVSGSGTTAIKFSYMVAEGDYDANGIAVSTSITLNSGTVKDAAGNDATLTFTPPTTASVLVDGVAPTVTGVTGPAAGTYKTGDELDFTATFSENITVSGSPYITLTIGSTTRNAVYVFGSGTTAIKFSYTVAEGDYDANGIAVSTSITLNSGTVKDAAGNDATLTFTPPTTASVLVDGVAPTVSSVSGPANGTYVAGGNLDFTVNFSENVTVDTTGGTPYITLTVGLSTVYASYVSGSGSSAITFWYTVVSGDYDANGIAIGSGISLNGGTIKDAAGNDATVTFTGSTMASVLVDAVAPTVTSVSVPANSTYGVGETLDFTVNFSETVYVDNGSTMYLSLTIGSTGVNAYYYSGSGSSAITFRYTVVTGDCDTNGISVGALTLNGAEVFDAARNDATLILNSVGSTTGVLVDAVAPTVTSVSVPANSTYGVGETLDFTVNFSETVYVDNGSTMYLSIAIGSTSVNAYYYSGSGSSAITFRYTVVTGDCDTNGISVGALSLNGAEVFDAVRNDATLTLNSVGSTTAVLVDAVAPTVTSVSVPANSTYGVDGNLDFTVYFSETVYIDNGSTMYLSLTIGSTAVNAYYYSGSGSSTITFRYTVVAGDNDTDGISVGSLTLDGAEVFDAVRNDASLALNSVRSTAAVLIDGIAPTVGTVTLAGDNTYIDLTFSKGVYGAADGTTALATADLAAVFTQNGGDATNVTISSVKKTDGTALAGGETTIRVFINITGTPSGVETVAIKPANGASVYDAVGNAMAAEQISALVTLGDRISPTAGNGGIVTITSSDYRKIGLSWTAATDNVTAQADLLYKVVYSITDNIATVDTAEANGVIAEDWTANLTSATATGLSTGTYYYFNVIVQDASGNKALYTSVSQKTSNKPEAPTTPTTGTGVLVNGQSQAAGTSETTTNANGQTVTTVTVDTDKLNSILEQEGHGATVTISTSGADVAAGVLTGQMVDSMEENDVTLQIRTDAATYSLPAEQIDINAVSESFGTDVSLADITVNISISEPTNATATVVEDAAKDGSFTLVVPAVEFSITCSYNGQTTTVSSFDSYVERTIAIPDGVDPDKITTGVVVDPDGTVHHVPTKIIIIDGKYYAVINSLTNSTYTVIYNPIEFADVASHWAGDAVNDMGSRMVVSGVGGDNYQPDRDITRAEFATIMVRALGLEAGVGDNGFSDVKTSDWYCGYIETAVSYGLITGYSDGTFRPNDQITREQAMTIIARAMGITELEATLTASEQNDLLAGYTDSSFAADYALSGIAACLGTAVVNGRTATTICPQDNITRAEVAVVVQRLLIKSGLINDSASDGEFAAVDYAATDNWLALSSAADKDVDIFYLYPTAYYKLSASDPIVCGIDNEMMRSNATLAFSRQATAFATEGNIYAPYYRQADATTCLSLSLEAQDELLSGMTKEDVFAAFEYYIENFNNGRPFILAGHSQGSNMLLYLLSEYMAEHPDVYNRMVAAYVIGYSVTEEYLAENPHLKFAEGADDTGVIISYNTQAPTIEGNNPIVLPDALVINPLTWTRDDTYAAAAENLGSIMLNTNGSVVLDENGEFKQVMNFADAYIDSENGVLICSTVDVDTWAPGNVVFGRGVFHSFDYPFYYYNLRENAAYRIQSFFEAN